MDETRKTHTSSEVKRRYNNKVYSRISIDVPKEMAQKFREKAGREGDSMAGILKDAIEKYINE